MFEKTEIDLDVVRALVSLDASSGLLFWKARSPDSFSGEEGYRRRAAGRWNAMMAGREALTGLCQGYKRGSIVRRQVAAHRVVWALHHGEWCPTNIDHINGDKTDNRPENLRAAAHEANSRNQKLRSSNTSGQMGVSWNVAAKAWVARINADGERKYLGKFADFGAAVAARKAAEARYGYDPTHGRVAA